jgi:hypothetical protein
MLSDDTMKANAHHKGTSLHVAHRPAGVRNALLDARVRTVRP